MTTTTARRILVVEDDPYLLNVWRMCLTRAGYKVEVATTAGAALRMYADFHPELVILDLMLADKRMSGYDIVLAIRRKQHDQHTYIMIVSGHGAEADQIHGMELGADDYLVKPLSENQLVLRVHARIQRLAPRVRDTECQCYVVGRLTIDLAEAALICGRRRAPLSPIEVRLLPRLLLTPNELVGYPELLRLGWGWTGGAILDHQREGMRYTLRYLNQKLRGLNAVLPIRIVRSKGWVLELEKAGLILEHATGESLKEV